MSTPADNHAFDLPGVDGGLTIMVLCYGDYLELAQRCLEPIVRTVPSHRMSLRVFANTPSERLEIYLRALPLNVLQIFEPRQRPKYPLLRAALRDPHAPVLTPWVVWFDDDSHAVHDDWCTKLCQAIHQTKGTNQRMIGCIKQHDVLQYADADDPWGYWKSGVWQQGRPPQVCRAVRLIKGKPTRVTYDGIKFINGGFWAIKYHDAIAADIPDVRAEWRCDITMGEQLYQTFGPDYLLDFDRSQQLVKVSDHPRRGIDQRLPWVRQT